MKISSFNRYFLIISALGLLLFFPSFFLFFTHDDFFHLLIAKPAGLNNFLSFLDITQSHQGYAHFRPLTTQVFYSLAWFTNLNPLPMHIINYVNYVLVCYLAYKLLLALEFKEKSAIFGLFLYATSATHFGRLYFLSTQEFGYSLFSLLFILYFIKHDKVGDKFGLILPATFYILALLSKESAIVTPFLILITMVYLRSKKGSSARGIFKDVIFNIRGLFPYFIITAIYLYFRIFHYGLAAGDSYIWDFSPRIFNTIFWYGVWSFNLPEMIVDFVGPGFSINPNLFKYWSREIIPIFIIIGIEIIFLCVLGIRKLRDKSVDLKSIIFGALWFSVSLLPVLFLPLHKFSFYLTLAMVGIVVIIMSFMKSVPKVCLIIFCFFWFTASYMTLKLSEKTHWITRGAETAGRVNDYFLKNEGILNEYKGVVFIDTDEDADLPWKPSDIVRVSLSDQNYFEVFHPGKFEVYYGDVALSEGVYYVEARQLIGY